MFNKILLNTSAIIYNSSQRMYILINISLTRTLLLCFVNSIFAQLASATDFRQALMVLAQVICYDL